MSLRSIRATGPSRRRTERRNRPAQTIDGILHFVARLLVLRIKQRPHGRRSLDERARVRDDRRTSPLAPHRERQLEQCVGVRCGAADQVSGAGKVELARRYRGRPGHGEQHVRPFKHYIFDCGESLDDTESDVELLEWGATITEIAACGQWA